MLSLEDRLKLAESYESYMKNLAIEDAVKAKDNEKRSLFRPSRNIFHGLRTREISKEKTIAQYAQARIEKNIQEGNCERTVFEGHKKPIEAFTVHGNNVLTRSLDGSIKCWDEATGKMKWNHRSKPRVTWSNQIFVSDSGRVVCARSVPEGISILSLRSGKLKAEIDNNSKMALLGNRLFTPVKEAILEWNLKGKMVSSIPSLRGSCTIFLGHENRLISVFNQYGSVISVEDLSKGRNYKINLPEFDIITQAVACEHLIFCEFRKNVKGRSASGCVFDPEKGRILKEYLANVDANKRAEFMIVGNVLIKEDYLTPQDECKE